LALLSVRLDIPARLVPKATFALGELAHRMGFGVQVTDGDTGDICYGDQTRAGFHLQLSADAAAYDGVARSETADSVAATYRLLTYAEERAVSDAARDRRGVFLTTALPPGRQRTIAEPLVEQFADALLAQLAARQPRVVEAAAPRWPAGKKYALVMTHDVDAMDAGAPPELAAALAKAVVRGDSRQWAVFRRGLRFASNAAGNPWFQFAWWRDWERRTGVRSAFYFFLRPDGVVRDWNDCRSGVDGRAADWGLFRAMADEGWEFGVHASIHMKDSPNAFAAARQWLETRLGRPVTGIRHHYFALDWRRPWRTHRDHARAGFEYDSSIAWRDAPGFRTGTSLPHHAYDGERDEVLPLTVVPCSLMDNHVTCVDVAGTRAPADAAAARAMEIVGRVRSSGGALVFNWHQETASNDLVYSGYRDVLEGIAARCFDDGDAWIATPHQLSRHWNERITRLATHEIAA